MLFIAVILMAIVYPMLYLSISDGMIGSDAVRALATILSIVGLFVFIIGTFVGYEFGQLRPLHASPPPPQIATTTEERKYCRYCGTENKSDAVFCEKCGKSLQ
jgi:vacuolar-type H+-ATPase subunit I/STV1